MSFQVTITRTDMGANTHVKSENREASKNVASWSDALTEAEQLGLINAAESLGAKALPSGLPLHTTADTELGNLVSHGFVLGKASPPQ
jgi:hypothetical protein